jgi:hypothetical protein
VAFKKAEARLRASFAKLSYSQKQARVTTNNSRIEKKLTEFNTLKSVLMKLAIGMFLLFLIFTETGRVSCSPPDLAKNYLACNKKKGRTRVTRMESDKLLLVNYTLLEVYETTRTEVLELKVKTEDRKIRTTSPFAPRLHWRGAHLWVV